MKPHLENWVLYFKEGIFYKRTNDQFAPVSLLQLNHMKYSLIIFRKSLLFTLLSNNLTDYILQSTLGSLIKGEDLISGEGWRILFFIT